MTTRRSLVLAAATTLAATAATPALAAPPTGTAASGCWVRCAPAPEHVVNTTTSADQYFPSAATNHLGFRLVAWTDTSRVAAGHDHDHDHEGGAQTAVTVIRARLLDPLGRPVGPELALEAPDGHQMYPAVTALDDGGFAVAWLHAVAPGQQEVRAARVGAFGTVGRATTVSERTTPVQFAPSITSVPGNGVAVAWTGAGEGDAAMWDAKARVLDHRLRPRGGELTLNRTRTDKQHRPALARTAKGFAAAWTDGSRTEDTDGTGVRGTLLRRDGRFDGPERQLNATTAGNQARPSLATLPGGSVAAAWETSAPVDGSGGAVTGRVLDRDLRGSAPERVLNQITNGTQAKPRLAALADGGCAAAWEDGSKSADDPIYLAVRSRVFDRSGAPRSADRLVNVSTPGNQQQPVVTAGWWAPPVVVWTDDSHAGTDTSGTAIRSRLMPLG